MVSEVARRHEITPQHLFAWRKAARAGRLTLPAEEAPMFVPVVTATHEVGAGGAFANRPGSIVIEIAGRQPSNKEMQSKISLDNHRLYKGVGELAIVGVAPAITNAIYHADRQARPRTKIST